MSYDSVVLGDSPTHYYATNETSGTSIADSGSSSAPGTLSGSDITYNVSIFTQKGFEFGTVGDTFFTTVMNVAAIGSFECLMRVYSDTANWAVLGIAPSGNPIPDDTGNRLLGTTGGVGHLGWDGVGPGGGSAMLADHDYHLVGVIHADGSAEVYLNGSLSASSTPGPPTPVATSGTSLYVPMGIFESPSHHVAIGKVAIYNGVALTGTQVAAHYAALSGGGGPPAFTGTAALSGMGTLSIPVPVSNTVVSTGAGAASVNDVSMTMYPDYQLTVMDLEVRRAPSSITFSVAGAVPLADIDFLMDAGDPPSGQSLVYTTQTDTDGGLGPTSLSVYDVLGGQQGTRTLTARQMVGLVPLVAATQYTVLLDPITVPRTQGPDADPVLIPEAMVNGVRHWVFQDLMGVELGGIGSYVLDHNPREMTSPHLEFGITSRHTTAHSGMFHVWQSGGFPKEWTFNGQTWSQEMLDQLAAYRALNRRFWVIDHRNRAWKTMFTNLEIVPHLRQIYNGEVTDLGTDWTVTAVILDQNWRNPV